MGFVFFLFYNAFVYIFLYSLFSFVISLDAPKKTRNGNC